MKKENCKLCHFEPENGHALTCPEYKDWEWADVYTCDFCGGELKPVYDEISKKMSEWTFECDCEGWPKGVVKSIG